jgi:hypothetical protein
MAHSDDIAQLPDICLLLRIHGEQRWLISEVEPLLRQLEQPSGLDDDELGPALAYLEVIWLESGRRAAETDATFVQLDPADSRVSSVLYDKACRYHAAVRRLRQSIDSRVRVLTSPVHDEVPSQEPANS